MTRLRSNQKRKIHFKDYEIAAITKAFPSTTPDLESDLKGLSNRAPVSVGNTNT